MIRRTRMPRRSPSAGVLVLRARGAVGGGARLQAVHQQQGGAMCETEEDERRQQHRRATTGVCERGEALCEDAEQQVRTMILVVRESMRRRYISQRYCRSRLR